MNYPLITEYIKTNGTTLSAVELVQGKSQCFMLDGRIETNLSVSNKKVYSINQIKASIPKTVGEITSTVCSILTKYIEPSYSLPAFWKNRIVNRVSDIEEALMGNSDNTVDETINTLEFNCALIYSFIDTYVESLNKDEGLLLNTLLYISYSCAYRIVKYSETIIDGQDDLVEVLVTFYENN